MKKRGLHLLKLFLILIFTGNLIVTAQDGTDTKSGGCGGSKNKNVSKSVDELAGVRWIPVEINGAKVENSAAFIEFNTTEKRITGNTGCNSMFGKYESNGHEIKFSGIGATRKFCTQEGVMKIEADFTKALEQTTRFERKSDTLKFYAGENLVLKFTGPAKNDSGH